MVALPKLQESLCFTVDGGAGDVLRLLEDPDRGASARPPVARVGSVPPLNVSPPLPGIIVDGRLMGAPPKHGVEGRPRTYFDLLTISAADITVTLSLDAVVVEGEGRDVLPAHRQGWVRRRGVTVAVDNHRGCWVELAEDVRFLVLFHQYQHPTYLQKAHLGFYITRGGGLSSSTQGLLGKPPSFELTRSCPPSHCPPLSPGEFQHADISVTPAEGAASARGVLRRGSQQVSVSLQDRTLKDSVQKQHVGRCWVVARAEVERLLDHPYHSYVVDRGSSSLRGP